MKAFIEVSGPDGRKFCRRLRGVDFFPEKRQLRAAFRPQVIGFNEDGSPRTDEDTATHDARLAAMGDYAHWGEPIETCVAAHYSVRICLLGRSRHVGTSKTPIAAGRLYDSAVFYCWGWMKRPKANFNFYGPGDPPPEEHVKVRELRTKLLIEARNYGLDPIAFNYTFAQRHTEPLKISAHET